MGREKQDYRANLARVTEFSEDGVLTVGEVARFLKIDRHTVTALIERGRLTGVNVGLGKKNAIYRVSAESLARFIS
jgi:excisionase family DNA binding protein